MPTAFEKKLLLAADHLRQQDPLLTPVINAAGLAKLTPHTNYYGSLVDSIISQQLSVKAAASIERRFKELFASDDFPSPAAILNKSSIELRGAGLSQAKANYIHDLARHIVDGTLAFDEFDSLSNEAIIAELTDVKGIGEWTAHMFLMFCMGRLDILPTGDLGIRNGVSKLYGFEDLPTPAQIREIADQYNWHPYESVASWYIWRSLDNQPAL